MLPAICLDHQHSLTADEVTDERPHWHLARELESLKLAQPQVPPEFPFCISGIVPQLLSAFGRTRTGLRHVSEMPTGVRSRKRASSIYPQVPPPQLACE